MTGGRPIASLREFARRACGVLASRANRGVAAVEFALYSVVFLPLLAGTTDVGMLIYTHFQLDAAVAAGAQYAVVNAANVNSSSGASLATSIATLVANTQGSGWANSTVVVNNGPSAAVTSGSASSSGTASNADSYYCPSGTPGSWTWGSAVAAGASCTGGGTAGKFVTVAASRTYSSIFPGISIVHSGPVSQSVIVQVQ
jgi:Flp pilus assembly protein TadG